jgi:ABC-type dipeptide/oligopeptide/nickel transport system permease component
LSGDRRYHGAVRSDECDRGGDQAACRHGTVEGLPRRQVFTRHIFRNAVLPVVTVVGLQIGFLLSGTIITEVIFSRPGIGRLLVDSILQKDYLTVQALVLLITLIYTTVNLIVDLIYPFIDPRIVY